LNPIFIKQKGCQSCEQWAIIIKMGGNTLTLEIGQQAPDFNLPSHIGELITLHEYRGKNVVLAFFPLAWTST